jgi:hypothetical protein
LLARGREHPTDDDATHYAAAYGLFIAAAVAAMFGGQVQEKLTLGGGVFDLDSRDGVTLTVTRATAAGPPAAEVTDALAGRPRPPCSAICQPTPAPPCRTWRTSSTPRPAQPGLTTPAKGLPTPNQGVLAWLAIPGLGRTSASRRGS